MTLAAQLGVAPVLLATFGPLPVASLPANLLAVPAAGVVMIWGLTGGMVAGLTGGVAAELLHLPTRLMLGWLAEVAARASTLPLGQLPPFPPGRSGRRSGAPTDRPRELERSPASPRRARRGSRLGARGRGRRPGSGSPPQRAGDGCGPVARRCDRRGRPRRGRRPQPPRSSDGPRRPAGGRCAARSTCWSWPTPRCRRAVVGAVERRHPIGTVVVAGGVGPLDIDVRRKSRRGPPPTSTSAPRGPPHGHSRSACRRCSPDRSTTPR